VVAESIEHSVERAISDYLAVSRARGTYASTEEYDRAEAKAWEVLAEALASTGQSDIAELLSGTALDRS